jgi:hypothetical protein
MQLEWIYYPVTQYSVTGVGLLASLFLWGSAKAEIRTIRKAMKKSSTAMESGVQNLSHDLEEIRKAQTVVVEPTPVAVGLGINLTKRAQILRMQRRGENKHSIAGALQLPLGEVDLILKIERLMDAEPVKVAV